MQIYSTEYLQTDSQEYIKKIIDHNQVNLVLEMQGCFNVQKVGQYNLYKQTKR